MAINILKNPQNLTPAYNDVRFVVESDRSFLNKFLYEVDINIDNNTIYTLKTPNNQFDVGNIDISKVISNEVTHDFDPDSVEFNIATHSIAKYDLNIQESWFPEINFNTILSSGGLVNYISGSASYLDVNDQIYIKPDNIFDQTLKGFATVSGTSSVGSAFYVETDQPTNLPGGFYTYSGTIHLKNFDRKRISKPTTSERYVFNGGLSYEDFIDWDYTIYEAQSGGGEFLTKVPNNYEVRRDSRMLLNAYTDQSLLLNQLRVTTINGSYTIDNPYSNITSNYKRRLMQIGVGPWNLNNSPNVTPLGGATLPIIQSNVNEYSIRVNASTFPTSINSMTFKINDKCTRYEKIQLIFLDKLGSFIPFTFDLVSRKNTNIRRVRHRNSYSIYPNSTNDYSNDFRGAIDITNTLTDTYIVTSNWVNQETSNFLMNNLFESPEVYWIKDNGETVGVNITDKSKEVKQVINDQIINYEFEFQTSVMRRNRKT